MIETTPISEQWMKKLRNAGYTFDTVFSNGRYEDLKTKLLEIGGEAVALVIDIEKLCPNILADGQLFINKSYINHGNDYHGFVLNMDGCWRYGTWRVHENTVTNGYPDDAAYFGILRTR